MDNFNSKELKDNEITLVSQSVVDYRALLTCERQSNIPNTNTLCSTSGVINVPRKVRCGRNKRRPVPRNACLCERQTWFLSVLEFHTV